MGFPSVAVWDCAVGPRGSVCGAVWVLMMLPFLSLLSAHSWKQHRDLLSPIDTGVSKNSLYTRTTNYIDAESPHLPKDLDHSLGIAREEVRLRSLFFLFGSLLLFVCLCLSSFFHASQIVTKEKEVLEWKRKYEDSRQEVVEMR